MFDIIIEDASHELRDQVSHFIEYFKLVKPNGYYIIEDVDGSNLEKLLESVRPFADATGFTINVYDGREKKNR